MTRRHAVCGNHPNRPALIMIQVDLEDMGLGKRPFFLCRECAVENGIEIPDQAS